MDVFTRDAGVYQGRISSGGEWRYELGHALNASSDINVGDYHEVSQTFVVNPGVLFVKPRVVVALPEQATSSDIAWELSAWFNGEKVIARFVRPSRRPLLVDDWRISLAASNPPPSTNVLGFRLTLAWYSNLRLQNWG